MAIDKAIYGAPMGLQDMSGPALDIEIDNPDMVTLDDGSVEITIMPGEEKGKDGTAFNDNLADHMDEGELNELSGDLVEEYDNDISSRKEWEKTYTEGLKLLGL